MSDPSPHPELQRAVSCRVGLGIEPGLFRKQQVLLSTESFLQSLSSVLRSALSLVPWGKLEVSHIAISCRLLPSDGYFITRRKTSAF